MSWKPFFRANVDYFFAAINVGLLCLIIISVVGVGQEPLKPTEAQHRRMKRFYVGSHAGIVFLMALLVILWVMAGLAKTGPS
jgi:hypothetical protein